MEIRECEFIIQNIGTTQYIKKQVMNKNKREALKKFLLKGKNIIKWQRENTVISHNVC